MSLKNYVRSSFTKSVFTMLTGTALAQIINFGFSIYLTRIYQPNDFGSVSVFLSVVAIFLVFSCGRYDVAMVASKTEKDAYKLFALASVVLYAVTFLLVIAAGIIYFFHIDFYNGTIVHKWLWYLPVTVFITTQSYIFWMWKVRQKKFREISYIRVVEAVVISVVSVLLKSFSALGLLLANMAASLSSMLILGTFTFKEKSPEHFYFTKKELKEVASEYSEFPKVNVLQGFNDMFQINAVPLVGGFFFAHSAIGFYSLCMRVLQAPISLIIRPIATVFFAEAADQHRGGNNLHHLVKKTIFQAMVVALPVPLISLAAGPQIFSFIFGSNWGEAGAYARILSIWIFFDLIRTSIYQVVSVIGRQKEMLYISLTSNALLFATLMVGGIWIRDTRTTLMIVSFSQAIFSCIIIFRILQMAKHSNPGTITS